MKTTITFLILFCSQFIYFVQAQEWAPIGAEWTYIEDNAIAPLLFRRIEKIRVTKDSLHNGINTRVLEFKLALGCSNFGGKVLTYERDGKVMVKLNDFHQFDTLYDFNATIGNKWNFSFANSDATCINKFIEIEVIDTSSILINGVRRKIHYYDVNDNTLRDCSETRTPRFEVIQGIGHTEFLFPFFGTLCDGPIVEKLRCYQDPNIGLYIHDTDVRDCEEITEFDDALWAPIDATWRYRKAWYDSSTPDAVFTIKVTGNTFLPGVGTVKVLEVDDGLGCTPTYFIIYTYAHKGNVLVKLNEDHPFDTLFDFNANLGDSWKFTVDTTGNDSEFKFTVVDIEDVVINGKNRRVQFCTIEIVGSRNWEFWGDTIEIIEGIGNTEYLFPIYGATCDDDYVKNLRCYYDRNVRSYIHVPNIVDCDIIANTSQPSNYVTPFNVYPNPSSDWLYIEPIPSKVIGYEIMDVRGQLIGEGELKQDKVDLQHLNSGVYFLRIKTETIVYVKQFLKI